MEWTNEELNQWKDNLDEGIYINPKTRRKIKITGPTYKSLEKEFKKMMNINIDKVEKDVFKNTKLDIKEEIQYPFTMPIMCFSCNTVISRIDIFNNLWDIYIKNINNNIDFINKMLKKDNIDKTKWMKKIMNNWWQKIGGFEKINDNINIDFIINNKQWKNIGIENICCRRMIYTHVENPLFVDGPTNY